MSKSISEISWTIKIGDAKITRKFTAQDLEIKNFDQLEEESVGEKIKKLIEVRILEKFIASAQYLLVTDKNKDIHEISWTIKVGDDEVKQEFSANDFSLRESDDVARKNIREKLSEVLKDKLLKKFIAPIQDSVSGKPGKLKTSKAKVSAKDKPTSSEKKSSKSTSGKSKKKTATSKVKTVKSVSAAKLTAIRNGGMARPTNPVTVEEAQQHSLGELKAKVSKDEQEIALLIKLIRKKEEIVAESEDSAEISKNKQSLESLYETVKSKEASKTRHQDMMEILKVHK
ncbi:MAG: hypothetical protein ABFQ62_00170 [Patescibacteria group bacterium]